MRRRLDDILVLTGRISCTSRASRCSSRTSPSTRCCSRSCSSTFRGVVLQRTAFAIAASCDEPHHLGDGNRGGPEHRPHQRRDRPVPQLPMWRPAVLVGRSLADILSASMCALIVALTGLAIGWSPEDGILRCSPGSASSCSSPTRSRGTAAASGSSARGRVGAGAGPDRPLPARVRLQRARPDQRMPTVVRAIAD